MAERVALERYIDERYKDAHISKIRMGEKQHDLLKKWMKKPMGFLILLGIPGCGKTYTSIAITRALFEEAAKFRNFPTIYYYPQSKIFDEFKDLYSHNWLDISLKEKLNESLLLTIDDFGSQRNNEWQIEVMTQIIESRYSSRRPTIINSNLDFPEIGNIFHARIRSRMAASENLVITDWETDLRGEDM